MSTKLRPMSEAPTTGPVVEILVATSNRAGCHGWLIAHYADGGGEEQPRFRGWFFWTGYCFEQIDDKSLLGWLPLPPVDRVTEDSITDEQIISVRDDESLSLTARVSASAALDQELPWSHGIRKRGRQRCAEIIKQRRGLP